MSNPLSVHDDPGARAFVEALPIEEKPLDWVLDQLPDHERDEVLGDVTAIKRPEGWAISLERRIGLDPSRCRTYDTWARERAYVLITTNDPNVDGWHHADADHVDTGEELWHMVCLRVDMPDPEL